MPITAHLEYGLTASTYKRRKKAGTLPPKLPVHERGVRAFERQIAQPSVELDYMDARKPLWRAICKLVKKRDLATIEQARVLKMLTSSLRDMQAVVTEVVQSEARPEIQRLLTLCMSRLPPEERAEAVRLADEIDKATRGLAH